VLEAGLTGLCLDISLDDFNIDVEKLEAALDDNVLAVIVAHMFGTPANIARFQQACRAHGAALIEDAAQACGARFDDQLVGTFGELAFLSLGRSKNLRGYKGGVLLVNAPALVEPVREEVARLPPGGWLPPTPILNQLAICALSAPRLWQYAKKVSWLHVGAEDQSFDGHPSRLPAWQAGLGLIALKRLDLCNAHRQHLARALEQRLAELPAVQVQSKVPQARSVYTRLALRLLGDSPPRGMLVSHFQAIGIDARPFYTRAMYQYDWWEPSEAQATCKNAEHLVATNLALPVYWGMSYRQLPDFADAVCTVLEAAAC